MKYMHFNSSCSYAGVANMLEMLGYDTEDYKIALDMGLPYLLRYDMESEAYQAGPMLQSAEWFNLYLRPRGFEYREQRMEKFKVPDYLRPGMMLGIQVTPKSKHAVVFLEKKENSYVFLNNKWEESEEPDVLKLSEEECLEHLPEQVMLGYVEQCEVLTIDMQPYYEEALETWEKLRKELHVFVSAVRTSEELKASMNRLFRPLLLDGLSMAKLLKDEELAGKLEIMQQKFLGIVRRNQEVCPAEEISCGEIDWVVARFVGMITRK